MGTAPDRSPSSVGMAAITPELGDSLAYLSHQNSHPAWLHLVVRIVFTLQMLCL